MQLNCKNRRSLTMDANSTFLRRKISGYKLPNILRNGKMERVRITVNTGLFKVEALTEVPGNPRDPISKAELDSHGVTKLGTKNLLFILPGNTHFSP